MATNESNLEQLIKIWEPSVEEPCIKVEHLNHYYGEGEMRKQVLFDQCLQIRRGEIVILKGQSGCGKTTLLTLIGTLRSVQEGSLNVIGKELNGVSAEDTTELRKKTGFIFQAHNLFESLTAFQNVRMSTELQGIPIENASPRIEAALTRLGLGHRIHYKPKSLSGGQKQRVAVARGIIHEPQLILADEPTAALDEESGREVVTIFEELANEKKSTVLIVTHDNRILDVADRIVVMEYGKIISNVLVKPNALMSSVIRDFSVFHSLTPQSLSHLAEKVTLKNYPSGSEIIRQGDIGYEFFLIGRGEVDVEVDGKVVNTLSQGAFFGEISLVKQQPRSATVRASSNVVCFVLSKDEFQAVMDSSQSFEEELRNAIFSRR